MEKILKRASQAAKTADKRVAKKAKHIKNSQEWSIRLSRQAARKAQSQLILNERQRRKEQWEFGPLAPRHDIGKNTLEYGAAPINMLRESKEFDARRPDWFGIAAGDRVVVTAGRWKGRISEVTQLNQENCRLQLKGIKLNGVVPEHMRELYGGGSVSHVPDNFELKNLKLVYALPDNEGKIRDVIVDQVLPIGQKWDKHTREWTRGHRVIAGTKTIIPWPEEIDEEYTANADDTAVVEVDKETNTPNLLYPPMPETVIDELRGKYSKFRTRHTYEMREKLEQKERTQEQRKGLIKTMRTPLQELAELRAKQKQQMQRALTPAQMEYIGKVMQQEKAGSL